MGETMDVLQAKVASLSHQNERLFSKYESMRDERTQFEQFCRGQLEDQARDLNSRKLVAHGLQYRSNESLKDLKDKMIVELGMAALPRFSLSRRLGGGMAVMELAVPDDKHAFFKHQSTPALRSKRVFFKDFLTVQEQKNTFALSKLHAEVKEAGLKPFFRGDVLHWTDNSGKRTYQTAEGLGARSREEQARRGWGGGNRGVQERAAHTPLVSRPSGQATSAGPSGVAGTRAAAQPPAVPQGGGGSGNGIGRAARKAGKAARQAQGAADTKEADAARREESRRATNEARARELRMREQAVQEQEEACRARELAAASEEARLATRMPQPATRGRKAAAAAAAAAASAASAVAAPGVAAVPESAATLDPGVVTAERDVGRSEEGSMAAVVPAVGGSEAACSLGGEGATRSQKRSQEQSALGRIAGAVTGALRTVANDVSEESVELFRSAAQVLGSPGWQEKQQAAAERPTRDLSSDSPGAERPPKQPARSGLGDHSSTARALFPARRPLQQQPQLTLPPPPPREQAAPSGAPIIQPSGSTESNRATASALSAMEIGRPS